SPLWGTSLVEGGKGDTALLASQIMAQAGFPCARALNLCIPALKPRGKIFPKEKDFREKFLYLFLIVGHVAQAGSASSDGGDARARELQNAVGHEHVDEAVEFGRLARQFHDGRFRRNVDDLRAEDL